MLRKTITFLLVALASLPSMATNHLIYCNSCSVSDQRSLAERELNQGDTLLVFNKSSGELKKWGLQISHQSGPYDEPQEGDEPSARAVLLRLNSSEYSLATSIRNVRSKIDKIKDYSINYSIDISGHTLYTSAVEALLDKDAHAALTLAKLENSSDWHILNETLAEMRAATGSSSVVGGSISIGRGGEISGSYTSWPGDKVINVTVTHTDGSVVVYEIDTSKRITNLIASSFVVIVARDKYGTKIPTNNAQLIAFIGNGKFYEGSPATIDSLERLFKRFSDNVSVTEYCEQQVDNLFCSLKTTSDGEGKVSYTFQCARGSTEACQTKAPD